jgi:hypothetical protein
MKTSKIIFFSLIAAIVIAVSAAFIDVKLTGISTSSIYLQITKEPVKPFKVIDISNSNIAMTYNDSFYIAISSMKDSIPPKLKYLIVNDTLRITDAKIHFPGRIVINLQPSDSATRIISVNSDISMENILLSLIHISEPTRPY